MSKASEWVRGYASRPELRTSDRVYAQVTTEGKCSITNPGGGRVVELEAKDAVWLAKWILDVFSERSEAP